MQNVIHGFLFLMVGHTGNRMYLMVHHRFLMGGYSCPLKERRNFHEARENILLVSMMNMIHDCLFHPQTLNFIWRFYESKKLHRRYNVHNFWKLVLTILILIDNEWIYLERNCDRGDHDLTVLTVVLLNRVLAQGYWLPILVQGHWIPVLILSH